MYIAFFTALNSGETKAVFGIDPKLAPERDLTWDGWELFDLELIYVGF